MAYYTKEALERIMEVSLENMEAFLEGKPLPNCHITAPTNNLNF